MVLYHTIFFLAYVSVHYEVLQEEDLDHHILKHSGLCQSLAWAVKKQLSNMSNQHNEGVRARQLVHMSSNVAPRVQLGLSLSYSPHRIRDPAPRILAADLVYRHYLKHKYGLSIRQNRDTTTLKGQKSFTFSSDRSKLTCCQTCV